MTVNINAASISSARFAEQASAPATPAAGFVRLYVNNATLPLLSMVNDAGTVTSYLGNSSGSGTGITFPVTQSPSTNANTLDDYEEGTWTPSLIGGFSSAPTGYTRQVGRYTKIGDVVYFSLDLNANGATANATAVQIAGLPYPSSSVGSATQSAFVQYQESFDTNAGDTWSGAANTTRLVLYDNTGATRLGNNANVNINNRIMLNGFYFT